MTYLVGETHQSLIHASDDDILLPSSSDLRILLTGDFIFSSSFDKTSKAWLFDVSELGEGNEERACVRTFKGHSKGVYPMVFIPAPDNLGDEDEVLFF